MKHSYGSQIADNGHGSLGTRLGRKGVCGGGERPGMVGAGG